MVYCILDPAIEPDSICAKCCIHCDDEQCKCRCNHCKPGTTEDEIWECDCGYAV